MRINMPGIKSICTLCVCMCVCMCACVCVHSAWIYFSGDNAICRWLPSSFFLLAICYHTWIFLWSFSSKSPFLDKSPSLFHITARFCHSLERPVLPIGKGLGQHKSHHHDAPPQQSSPGGCPFLVDPTSSQPCKLRCQELPSLRRVEKKNRIPTSSTSPYPEPLASKNESRPFSRFLWKGKLQRSHNLQVVGALGPLGTRHLKDLLEPENGGWRWGHTRMWCFYFPLDRNYW